MRRENNDEPTERYWNILRDALLCRAIRQATRQAARQAVYYSSLMHSSL